MRQVSLLTTRLPPETVDEWVGRALSAIEEASGDQPAESSADAMVLANFDEVLDIQTVIDVGAPDLLELTKAVATLIFYIQKRGPDRTQ
jgi:hypothetical protein